MSELVAMTSVSDVMTMADVVVKSGLFPMFKTRESAAAMMLLCRSKGLDPMTAIERYHVVQGRPVMRATLCWESFCVWVVRSSGSSAMTRPRRRRSVIHREVRSRYVGRSSKPEPRS